MIGAFRHFAKSNGPFYTLLFYAFAQMTKLKFIVFDVILVKHSILVNISHKIVTK